MTVHANVKPLMHWLIYRRYTVRITERATTEVSGVITTPDGPISFHYDPIERIIMLPTQRIAINEYGWEVDA